MSARAVLITIEGIDGCGKSAVINHLKTKKIDDNIIYTVEPTDGAIGSMIKKSLRNGGMKPLVEAFMFTADHAEHLAKVIKPSLEAGKNVISDRYSDSRYAYQGASLKELALFDDAVSWVKKLHEGWTVKPDLTLLLLVSPEVAFERCSSRGKRTKFESVAFLKVVHENYLRLANEEPDRFVCIDAEQPLEKMLSEAENVVVCKIKDFATV